MRLKDKVAIITGNVRHRRSHGLSVCQRRRQSGHRRPQQGKGTRVVQKIKENRGEAMFVRTDVSVEEDIINLMNETVKEYGKMTSCSPMPASAIWEMWKMSPWKIGTGRSVST